MHRRDSGETLPLLPKRSDDDPEMELFELRVDAEDDFHSHYSCVAIYRRHWREGWPALGGTRWLQSKNGEAPTREDAAAEARELALAMYVKNNILRKAEIAARGIDSGRKTLYGWQGGKGVIWTPWAPDADYRKREFVTPRRLMNHGLLVDRLQGDYIASKDAGIGGDELRWVERATNFTIGNGCDADTGEATAVGLCEAVRFTLRALDKAPDDDKPFAGVPVLICGLGKVGFPFLKMAHDRGAEVWIYEKHLARENGKPLLDKWYEDRKRDGAAIDDVHRDLLRANAERIYDNETDALTDLHRSRDARAHVICPAGSNVKWLTDSLEGSTRPRYEVIADRDDADRCFIIGPSNDVLPISDRDAAIRNDALERMASRGVVYLPDPIVSPGGVIAVSHELTAKWDRDRVNEDASLMVASAMTLLFEQLNGPDRRDSRAIYRAFESLAAD